MAKIVITSTTNGIKVVFNDYASVVNMKKGYWLKSHLKHLEQLDNNTFVEVTMTEEGDWPLSYDGEIGSFQVDTINGVAPTSNSDLYDKLEALFG